MKEEIHPFVEDVVRWFDADICKLRPELRSVAFIDRVGILLAFLASVTAEGGAATRGATSGVTSSLSHCRFQSSIPG